MAINRSPFTAFATPKPTLFSTTESVFFAEAMKEFLKFPAALWTFNGGNGYSMGGMMYMGRGMEPSLTYFCGGLWSCRRTPFRRRWFQAHRIWCPLCGETMVWVLPRLALLLQELSFGGIRTSKIPHFVLCNGCG